MRLKATTTCFLICLFTTLLAYPGEEDKFHHFNTFIPLNSNPYNSAGLHYISFGFGVAGWYNSLQPGMANLNFSLNLKLSYGRTESAFELMLGANILSTYVLDDFLLNPNHFSFALNYQPFMKINNLKNFRVFAFAGVNYSYTLFTEREYSGVIDYNYKAEEEFGFGFQLGTTLSYQIGSFEIGTSFEYNTGSSDFYAGYFTKQNFDTGSMQLHILLKYNIVFDKNKNLCPTYRNFHRFEL